MICAFFSLHIACAISRPDEDISSLPWRSSANGGINSLYCYLRANKVSCRYADLLREQAMEVRTGPATAATLVRVAMNHGFPLQPVLLTMDELRSCAMPVVVHIDGESPEAGKFLLVLGEAQNRIAYVNGPTASIQMMDRADFRRVWSGIALLPARNRRQYAVLGTVGFSVGLILSLVLRSIQFRKLIKT